MKFLYGLMCAVLLVSMPVYSADISKEKKELIKEFFELTNSTDMGEMISRFYVRDMTDILRSSRPDIDPRAFEILKEEVNTVIREELLQADVLLEMSYPIYDKYFSAEELEDLIRFFKSPAGRKFTDTMPGITRESMEAGEIIGQKIGPLIGERVVKRLQIEGIRFQ